MDEAKNTILVCIDFSDVTTGVLEEAKRLAGAFSCRLVLLHVCMPEPEFVSYDPGPEYIREDFAHRCREAHKKAQELQAGLEAERIPAEALVVQGTVVEKIVEKADPAGTRMIVMGSHGHGALYELLVGSATEGVLRRARVPVLVVPVDR